MDIIKSNINRWYTALKAQAGFKVRKAQLQMVRALVKGYEEDKIPLIEADTGTGKTLANLLVGYACAQAESKKLILSTSTIQLQLQLINKDIPFFQHATGENFKVAMVKGQSNYFCPLRAEDLLGRHTSLKVTQLAEAYNDGWNGDYDSLSIKVDVATKNQCSRRAGCCLESQCPYYDSCPYQNLKRSLEEADVLIVNHSLVFACQSDSCVQSILPEIDDAVWIFDEAHQLPSIALQQSTREWEPSTLRTLFFLPGHLPLTVKTQLTDELRPHLTALQEFLEKHVQQLHLHHRYEQKGLIPGSDTELTALITSEVLAPVRNVRQILERFVESEKLLPKQTIALKHLLTICESTEEHFHHWFGSVGTGQGRWISDQQTAFVCLDLDQHELFKSLWKANTFIALTSATLALNGDFSFFRQQAHLPSNVLPVRLDPVFDYPSQRSITVDKAFWRNDSTQEEALTRKLTDDLQNVSGGSLVLFTSRKLMQQCYEALSETPRHYQILLQTKYPRSELIEKHKAIVDSGGASVIFGLRSCGEGLDLPGDYCKTVIITKLDFDVPTDPEQVIREAWYRQHNQNYFSRYVLPTVGQRLKQTAGRLIRTEQDRGHLKIYDPRVNNARYKQHFDLGY